VTTQTIAVIGGDGIGPEVVAEGLKVLKAVAGEGAFTFDMYDLGAERWLRTGEVLTVPRRAPRPYRLGCSSVACY